MAKCPICESRKGKRKCQVANDNWVCSLCCGTQRDAEQCAGCSYYQPPRRKYDALPSYALHEMDGNFTLEEQANSLESAIVAYDIALAHKLTDPEVIAILEQLLNVYHFGDSSFSSGATVVDNGAEGLKKVIEQDLPELEHDEITRLLGTVRASAKRRAKYGRDYLAFISKYVGARVDSGVRVMQGLM